MNKQHSELDAIAYIESYLRRRQIHRDRFMTYDFLQRMTYFVECKHYNVTDAFVGAISCSDVDPDYTAAHLSPCIRFVTQEFEFAEYSSDFPARELCSLQEVYARPYILEHLSELTDSAFIDVISCLGFYFSIADLKILTRRRFELAALSDYQLLTVYGALSRLVSFLTEWLRAQLCAEDYDFYAAVRALRRYTTECAVRNIYALPVAAFQRTSRFQAHLKYAQAYDYNQFEKSLPPIVGSPASGGVMPEISHFYRVHGYSAFTALKQRVFNISEQLGLFRQKHNFMTVYDFRGLPSLKEVLNLLRHEPFGNAMQSENCFLVSRSNIIIDYVSFLIARAGDIKKADLFLRQEFRVKFAGEKGADGGGLRREFLYNIVTEFFKSEYGVFRYYSNGLVWPDNFYPLEQERLCRSMRLFGILIGLCVLNCVCVESRLPLAFFKIICRYDSLWARGDDVADAPSDFECVDDDYELAPTRSWYDRWRVYPSFYPRQMPDLYVLTYEDVGELDSELCARTLELQHLRDKGMDIEDLELYFCAGSDVFGAHATEDLIVNGRNIRVTNANLAYFIHQRLSFELTWQFRALEEARLGFQQIIPQFKLEHTTPAQMRAIVCGAQVISFAGLRKVTKYGKPYSDSHTVIKMFWQVLEERFSQTQKEDFLTFVFCSPRVPVSGFTDFVIEREGDITAFPCAHTCARSLSLPPYPTIERMQEKLAFAIQFKTGFGVI